MWHWSQYHFYIINSFPPSPHQKGNSCRNVRRPAIGRRGNVLWPTPFHAPFSFDTSEHQREEGRKKEAFLCVCHHTTWGAWTFSDSIFKGHLHRAAPPGRLVQINVKPGLCQFSAVTKISSENWGTGKNANWWRVGWGLQNDFQVKKKKSFNIHTGRIYVMNEKLDLWPLAVG